MNEFDVAGIMVGICSGRLLAEWDMGYSRGYFLLFSLFVNALLVLGSISS